MVMIVSAVIDKMRYRRRGVEIIEAKRWPEFEYNKKRRRNCATEEVEKI